MRKSNTPISQNILTHRIYIYRGQISLLKSPISQLQSCPDHLNIAELPVAKSLGLAANGVTLVKTVGRRSRRPLGERVHFCVQCDFPIAIYGCLVCITALLLVAHNVSKLGVFPCVIARC